MCHFLRIVRPTFLHAGRREKGRGSLEGGHAPRAALCRRRHLEGRKYGILKFGCFWRIGVCVAERIRREFALRNYTPQLSVLFVTVRTNAVVVTTRISNADLIGVGGTRTFAPGSKHPRAAAASSYTCVCNGIRAESRTQGCDRGS